MPLKKCFYLLVLIAWSNISVAQESGKAAFYEKLPAHCKVSEPDKDQVLDLINSIQEEKIEINSVDGFLAALPETMRKQMIMMTESRSFQVSSAKSPRVLLKSPNSQLVLSFNSDPSHRGYDRIEVMSWNEKIQKFDFIDLQFPEDQKAVPGFVSIPSISQKTVVSKNPTTCLKCHSEPAKPNWDPYNFWAGQTPFNRDTLSANSPENEIYANILTRIKNGESRFRHLKPHNSVDAVLENISKGKTFSLNSPDNPGDGPGVRVFDQLSKLNFCRVGSELNTHPQKDLFKFAYAYVNRCGLPAENAMPDWVKQKAANYFESRGIKDANGKFSMEALMADTKIRQDTVIADKKARQKLFFERVFQSEEKALAAMNARPMENKETSLSSVLPYRYLLEPFDVRVSAWSMSIDPATYTFADVFSLAGQGPVVELGDLNCDELKAKSLETLNAAKPPEQAKINSDCTSCNDFKSLAEQKAISLVSELNETAIKNHAATVFKKYGCVECHDPADGFTFGAPDLPFSQMIKMDKLLQENRGALATFGDLMWSRITRDAQAPGRMPSSGPPLRDPADLAAVRAYINLMEAKTKAANENKK